MEVGEPDFLPPTEVKTALEQVYDQGFTKYGQAKGLPQLRSALAKKMSSDHNAKVEQENILVSPGGTILSVFGNFHFT